MSMAQAHLALRAITLAPSRKDHRDRHMAAQLPAHRVAESRYREDGMLLPFGYSRAEYTVPNPTLFHSGVWPMKDSALPADGYELAEILKTEAYGANNDIYGKLFFHIRSQLLAFRRRLSSLDCTFHMTNCDAAYLPLLLGADSFARIEVANISDDSYLGIERTISTLTPLLQTPKENPHATLVTLFMNAIHQVNSASIQNACLPAAAVQKAKAYLKTDLKPSTMAGTFPVAAILAISAHNLLLDFDKLFDNYMMQYDFRNLEEKYGVQMKKNHTIIDKWPLRLKLALHQPGAHEEFDVLFSSAHTGCERYVEWKRS